MSRASPEEEGGQPRAVVALIGTAGANAELASVLTELLERQGVKAEIESEDGFDPQALLSEGEHDARVRVFVVLRGEHQARLYFRSPLGERFLLRKLALRSGLDEIGRELIAQVVETSTVALLRSSAGISRDEASASLSEEREEAAPPEPVAAMPVQARPPKTSPEPRPKLVAAIGGALVAQWLGEYGPPGKENFSVDAVGFASALGVAFPSAWVVRGRLGGEYRPPESVPMPLSLDKFSSFSLRPGVDVGRTFGVFGLFLGVAMGADFNHARPVYAMAPVKLAPASDSTAAVFRSELRLEQVTGHIWGSAGVFMDVATAHTHYDFVYAGAAERALDLWTVRPGFSVTIGWSSFDPHDTRKR